MNNPEETGSGEQMGSVGRWRRRLTQQLGEQRGPSGLRQVDSQEVDGDPRQGDGYANQRVDGVAVQRHGHQEDAAQAEHHREGQRELWRRRPPGGASGSAIGTA